MSIYNSARGSTNQDRTPDIFQSHSQQAMISHNNNNYNMNQPQPHSQQTRSAVSGGHHQDHSPNPNTKNPGISPANQFLPARSFFCSEHAEPITNFSVNTQRPLCPECISELQSSEGSLKSHVIDSFKNVKANCSKKLKTGIYELTRSIENSELAYLTQPEAILEEGKQEIQRAKQAMYKAIDSHFENVFASFKAHVDMNAQKALALTTIFERIRESIFELERLSTTLDQGDTIEAISKVCSIDLKSLITTFNEEVHGVVDSSDLDPVTISIDQSALNELKVNLLPRIAIIQKQNHSHNHYQQQQQQLQQQQQHFQHHSANNNKQQQQQSILHPSNLTSKQDQFIPSHNQSQHPKQQQQLQPRDQMSFFQSQKSAVHRIDPTLKPIEVSQQQQQQQQQLRQQHLQQSPLLQPQQQQQQQYSQQEQFSYDIAKKQQLQQQNSQTNVGGISQTGQIHSTRNQQRFGDY